MLCFFLDGDKKGDDLKDKKVKKKKKRKLEETGKKKLNVLFLTSENAISRIIYSLFRGKQNIFSTIFSTKFVVKYPTKILKIGWQIQKLCPKTFLNREFSIEN